MVVANCADWEVDSESVVGETVTDCTAIELAATVTTHTALFPPTVAVMFAVPIATAVTTPVVLTVATSTLLLVQVAPAVLAVDGVAVKKSVAVPPGVKVKVLGETNKFSILTGISVPSPTIG